MIDGKKWICSQIGARQHYSVPAGLNKAGMLEMMFTDIWSPRYLRKCPLPGRTIRAFACRNNIEIPSNKNVHFGWGATAREVLFKFKLKLKPSTNPFEHYVQYGSWFAKSVAERIQKLPLDPGSHLFHGFTTGSLESMRLLRDRGIPCVLQQIDAGRVHYDLIAEEAKHWPGWELSTIKVPEYYFLRNAQEWTTASVVIVNSKWAQVALSTQGVLSEKMLILPLYYDRPAHMPEIERDWKAPLKVLWLGEVVLGKGIQYLIGAARRLTGRNITFLIAGAVGISREALSHAPANMQFLGRVPRGEVGRYYSQCHIFAFPTISDGFGLTQLEAMAYGLPVIATTNCGEVVSNGVDGYVIPARDEKLLAEAIARLDDDRELLCRMAENTSEKVNRFSLKGYGNRLTTLVTEFLAETSVQR